MADKKSMASKMVSKEYKTTRCGHCGKFGHHHSDHEGSAKDAFNKMFKGSTPKDIPKVKKTWGNITDKEREYLMDAGHFGPHLH